MNDAGEKEREKQDKPEMITKSTLKERGWTASLINKFLPWPDLFKPNPHHKRAAQIRLYKLNRVINIEKDEEFKKLTISVEKRKEASKKAVKTKLNNLKKYLETIEINLPQLSKDQLIKRACSHYNDMQLERSMCDLKHSEIEANQNSDALFLNRISVNYLRHSLTQYEEELDIISGKVGFIDGYIEIRDKIFAEIIKKYPWLSDECKRQSGEI